MIAACGSSADPPSPNATSHVDPAAPRKLISATELRTILRKPDEVAKLDELRIQPLGHHAARYIVHVRGSAKEVEADAEYPGTIEAAIEAAGIKAVIEPERVVAEWPHDNATHEVTEAAMRRGLDCPTKPCQEANQIQEVRIEPIDGDRARYVVLWRTRGRHDVVLAAFPGDFVELLAANEILYAVRAPRD